MDRRIRYCRGIIDVAFFNDVPDNNVLLTDTTECGERPKQEDQDERNIPAFHNCNDIAVHSTHFSIDPEIYMIGKTYK